MGALSDTILLGCVILPKVRSNIDGLKVVCVCMCSCVHVCVNVGACVYASLLLLCCCVDLSWYL